MKRIKTEVLCDLHYVKKEEEIEADSYSLGGSLNYELDLCESCSQEPFIELLQFAFEQGFLAKKVQESEALICQECGKEAKSKAGLGRHISAQHKKK